MTGTKPIGRRKFLFGGTKIAATLMVAQAGVYAVGSAFKNLDGSLVAGAKSWYLSYQTGNGSAGCGSTWIDCTSPRGSCSTGGATTLFTNCGCDGANERMNGVYKCQ